MARMEKDYFGNVLAIVTFAPGIGGTLVAVAILLNQSWRWWQTGQWQQASLAGFVPRELVAWAVAKEGSLLGLKELVHVLLSLHASVWFFVVGWTCTFVLYEMAKPWLKE